MKYLRHVILPHRRPSLAIRGNLEEMLAAAGMNKVIRKCLFQAVDDAASMASLIDEGTENAILATRGVLESGMAAW